MLYIQKLPNAEVSNRQSPEVTSGCHVTPGPYYFERYFHALHTEILKRRSVEPSKSRTDIGFPRQSEPRTTSGDFHALHPETLECRSVKDMWHSSIMTRGAHLSPFDCVICVISR
jgi:hypothetical protein